MQRSLQVSPECMPTAQCAPFPTIDKMEGGLLVLFPGRGLSIAPLLLKIFLPTPFESS